jgi:hypothetical protein
MQTPDGTENRGGGDGRKPRRRCAMVAEIDNSSCLQRTSHGHRQKVMFENVL